jgi:hypothetical protein
MKKSYKEQLPCGYGEENRASRKFFERDCMAATKLLFNSARSVAHCKGINASKKWRIFDAPKKRRIFDLRSYVLINGKML